MCTNDVVDAINCVSNARVFSSSDNDQNSDTHGGDDKFNAGVFIIFALLFF